jgi:hypothetical protein
MLNFMKICPVGAALIHVECPKLIDVFCDCVDTPKMGIKFYQQSFKGRDLGT